MISPPPEQMDAEARFGPGAARLARMAARQLGWRPGEFWISTPAEFVGSIMPEDRIGAAPPTRDDIRRMIEAEEHG